ncbi:hypothetical protein EPD60_12345 [Flaviaesturariibacter flavus]|uniref:Uncharacterized protein n=1 Tax=Flaviaesturariibacter flavus TaxID=2502780 RepID=A0A4R1B9I9_9BACT|nr:hypothetical protein [Flaviaesturariibacter flavus]TCJ13581.1 hypothetical protein EPD60_12345 [Flaviaesturariibacter flavus]
MRTMLFLLLLLPAGAGAQLVASLLSLYAERSQPNVLQARLVAAGYREEPAKKGERMFSRNGDCLVFRYQGGELDELAYTPVDTTGFAVHAARLMKLKCATRGKCSYEMYLAFTGPELIYTFYAERHSAAVTYSVGRSYQYTKEDEERGY